MGVTDHRLELFQAHDVFEHMASGVHRQLEIWTAGEWDWGRNRGPLVVLRSDCVRSY